MFVYIGVLLPFIISPGASYALTIAAVEKKGFIGTRDVIVGTVLGIAVHALFAAAGISTLVMEVPYFTHFIKIFGSIMLIYLGFTILLSLLTPRSAEKHSISVKKVFMFNLLNIKPVLLYLTVIPSFIQEYENTGIYMHYIYFGTAHILLQTAWLLVLGYIVSVMTHQKLRWIIKLISLTGSLFLIVLGGMNLINFIR